VVLESAPPQFARRLTAADRLGRGAGAWRAWALHCLTHNWEALYGALS
jgi:hypothetical protein